MRILIVEDYPDAAAILLCLFRSLKHDVMAVGTADAALALFDTHEFDLLLSDIGLPGCDGWELMRQVRLRWTVKAIAFSGFTSPDDVQRSRAAGFDAHAAKPIDLAKLSALVEKVMAADGPLSAMH